MEFLSFKKKKKKYAYRGCVTKWYQSMVTTLGLLGLMNRLCRDSIQSTPKTKKSNPLS